MRKNFTLTTIIKRFLKQANRCANCKRPMQLQIKTYVVHHIDGDPANADYENCAVLCSRTCHFKVHFGNYGGKWIVAKKYLFLENDSEETGGDA